MPLTNCRECHKEVSEEARACPHCGISKPGMTFMGRHPILLTVMGLIVFFWIVASFHTGGGRIEVDRSSGMQKKREAAIRDLQRHGVLGKIESDRIAPRVWVRPSFYGLEFEDKKDLAGVLWAYHFDGSNVGDFIRLIDAQSGKEIGQYNPALGLRLK